MEKTELLYLKENSIISLIENEFFHVKSVLDITFFSMSDRVGKILRLTRSGKSNKISW